VADPPRRTARITVLRGSTVAGIAACATPERVDLRARGVGVREGTP